MSFSLSSAIFIRGLYEAFSRNPRNVNLRVLLRSYVDVQVRIETLSIFGYRPNHRSSTTPFSILQRINQPIPRVGTGLHRRSPLGDSWRRWTSWVVQFGLTVRCPCHKRGSNLRNKWFYVSLVDPPVNPSLSGFIEQGRPWYEDLAKIFIGSPTCANSSLTLH